MLKIKSVNKLSRKSSSEALMPLMISCLGQIDAILVDNKIKIVAKCKLILSRDRTDLLSSKLKLMKEDYQQPRRKDLSTVLTLVVI